MKGLDRYITGNWGEDSVPDLPPECDVCPTEKHNACEFIRDVGKSPCDEVVERYAKEFKKEAEMWDQMAEDYKGMEDMR